MPSGSNSRGRRYSTHRLAGDLLHDGRQHVARGRVVDEERARLVRDGQREKRLHHALLPGERKVADVLVVMPGRHRQQIADAHRLEVRARLRRRLVGKEAQHRVVDAQLAVGDREAHCRRREALAEREQHVRLVGGIGRPPAFRDDLPVPHEHEAVQRVELLLGLLDEAEDGRRTKCPALPGRCAGR